MRVNVKVRSASFEVECGSGTNRALWLAVQAKQRYARLYDLDPDSITPIDVFNQDGNPAWPHDLIVDCVKPGDVLTVQIRDCEPIQTEATVTTLWEKFAVSEPKDYIPVLFVLDLRGFDDPDAYDDVEISFRQKEDDDDVISSDGKLEKPIAANNAELKPKPSRKPKPKVISVIGNFTKWRHQVLLTESETPKLYSVQLRMPPAAVLLFRFHIDDRWVVSEAHRIMMDSKGLRLNVITVPGGKQNQSDDAGCHFKSISMPRLELMQLGDLALGEFAKGELEIKGDQYRLFKEDWTRIHSKRLVTTADMYRALKDTLWSHYRLLAQVFKLFSTHSVSDGNEPYMTNMQFWAFCQKCRIPSRKLFLHQITELSYNHGDTAVGKVFEPNNPDNQLTRPELFEALIRLSIAKYSKLSPASALETIVTYYIKPYALRSMEENEIRAMIAETPVQQVYLRFQHDLRDLFDSYCSRKGKRFTIEFAEFKSLLTEYGIKTDGRAAKQTAMLFSCCQEDVEDEENPGHQMVFGEFLEALVRLADIRYREKLPLDCKLLRLLNDVFFRKAVRQITSS